MKKALMTSLIFAAAVSLLLPAKETAPPTIEDFLTIPSHSPSTISWDDSKMLIGSAKDGQLNVYEMDLFTKEMRQLTHAHSEPNQPLAYLPDGSGILFKADGQGNEISHLFYQEGEKEPIDITPFENVKMIYLGFNRERTYFYLLMNLEEQKTMSLYKMEPKSWNLELIYSPKRGFDIADISEDEQLICLTRREHTHDQNLYLLKKGAEEPTLLTPHEGEVLFSSPSFNRANDLLFLTDEGRDFTYLCKMDPMTKQREPLIEADWDITTYLLTHNEKYLVVRFNEDSLSKLRLYSYPSLQEVPLPKLEGYAHASAVFSKSEKFLAIGLNSPKSPTQVHLLNLETHELEQLTFDESPLDKETFVDAQSLTFASYDGLEIPSILYMPKGEGPFPALVWAHGGPGGQSQLGWSPYFQYLASQGFAILAVNNRGSSGYGKTFFSAADKKHGDADLMDYIFAKEYLKRLPQIDGERIGVIGASYGGYITLAALTFHPDCFACGIDLFGVSNWLRTLTEYPPWWENHIASLHEKIGHPATDHDYLVGISPLFHADKITKPLFVLQGANDPRVVQAESDEIVEQVRLGNTPCVYLLFEDEGHGLTQKENRILAWQSIKEFLDRYLKG